MRALHRPTSTLKLLEGIQVEHVVGDITQPETLNTILQGVDFVFHTAAQLGRPVEREILYRVNVLGTRNVLQAAMEVGVKRVIHTSTAATLGVPRKYKKTNHIPPLINEFSSWNYPPRWWPYGHSKYKAEMEVQTAVAGGLDVVIINPSLVIGPGDINQIGGNAIIHAARKHLFANAPGGVNVIHIDDLVEGQMLALNRGRSGERYILAGENLSLKDYISLICEVVGVKPPGFMLPGWFLMLLPAVIEIFSKIFPFPISSNLARKAGCYFYYSTRKANIELGYARNETTRSAVQQAFDWYRVHQII